MENKVVGRSVYAWNFAGTEGTLNTKADNDILTLNIQYDTNPITFFNLADPSIPLNSEAMVPNRD